MILPASVRFTTSHTAIHYMHRRCAVMAAHHAYSTRLQPAVPLLGDTCHLCTDRQFIPLLYLPPNAKTLGGVLLVEDVVGALVRERLTETKLTGRERVGGSDYALRTG
jgi:hypothetical protein